MNEEVEKPLKPRTYQQDYYERNREQILCYSKEYRKEYYKNNKAKFKMYYQNHRKKLLEYQTAYNSKNTEKIVQYQNKYWSGRRKYRVKPKDPEIDKAKFEQKVTVLTWD